MRASSLFGCLARPVVLQQGRGEKPRSFWQRRGELCEVQSGVRSCFHAVLMGSDRSQVRRDRLRRDRGQVLEEPVDKPEWLVDVVRWSLFHQVGRWSGGRYDEQQHPAHPPSGGTVEDALEQHVDGPVVEQAAIG